MAIINTVIKGGGVTPTGTISITANGTHDVTNYASANVNVPTTAPARYLAYEVSGGKLVHSTTDSGLMDFSGVTTIDAGYLLQGAYKNNTAISGAVSFPNLTTVSGAESFNSAFLGCTGITSVSFPSLTSVTGTSAFINAFNGCTNITSINFSNLVSLTQTSAFSGIFSGCTSLSSVSFPSLTTISVSFGSWAEIMATAFMGCTSLTTASFPALTTIDAGNAMTSCFQNCTSLTTVTLGGTTAIDFGSSYTTQFTNMFSGCTQNITVNAPAGNQSTIEAMSGYPNFGGSSVTWVWQS